MFELPLAESNCPIFLRRDIEMIIYQPSFQVASEGYLSNLKRIRFLLTEFTCTKGA